MVEITKKVRTRRDTLRPDIILPKDIWRFFKSKYPNKEIRDTICLGFILDNLESELIETNENENNENENYNIINYSIGQRVVAKTLEISLEKNLFHEDYGIIYIKTSRLNINNDWVFVFNKKRNLDTYICLGFDEDRKNILRVWVIPNKNEYQELNSKTISNSTISLLRHKKLEIVHEPFNNTLNEMLKQLE